MALESTPVFQARVQALNLGEFWPKFESQGWTTIGEFAFALRAMAPKKRKAKDKIPKTNPELSPKAKPVLKKPIVSEQSVEENPETPKDTNKNKDGFKRRHCWVPHAFLSCVE